VPDRVIVVGGGLVGLCTAWFLRAAGAWVTVLEAERPGSGASRGNAGAICPSLVDPLPAPGTIRRAFLSMPRSDAALHVRPTYAPRMAGFLRRFAAAATRERYEAGYAALAGLAAGAGGAWDVLAAGGVRGDARREGYLIVHAERSDAERSLAHVCRAASLGLCREPGELLDHDGLVQREPLLGAGARAGFVIPDERWVDPSVLVDELAAALVRSGVELVEGSPVDDVRDGPDDVVVHGGGSMRRADAVVVAAGVWSAGLLRRLVRLPLLPGKGYSFSLRPASLPVRVVHLEDAHVMLTPMGDRLRVAGTMEFDGTTGRFNPRRIDAIVRAVRPFLDRDVELDRRGEEWVGPRPITPDGLPYLGAVAGHPRVFVAAGHNMLGLTLAAVSGRAIAGLVGGGERRPELDPFDPGRFGG
jgi:D-amino-acid dehydrogenase